MPSDTPTACARRSTNHAPALCRVARYSLPGLPKPTINRNGVMIAPVYHAGANKKARREPPGGPSCADDWLLLGVLFVGSLLRALFRSFLGALLRALFGRFLAFLSGFHRRAFDDGTWLNHRGNLFDFSDDSRHDRRRDNRAFAAARHGGHSGWQGQIRNVDRLSHRQS